MGAYPPRNSEAAKLLTKEILWKRREQGEKGLPSTHLKLQYTFCACVHIHGRVHIHGHTHTHRGTEAETSAGSDRHRVSIQKQPVLHSTGLGYKTIMIDDNRSQSPVNMSHLGRLVVHLESIRTPSIPHSTSMSSAFCHREVDVWP